LWIDIETVVYLEAIDKPAFTAASLLLTRRIDSQ